MKSEAREVAHEDRKSYFIDELCRRVLSMDLAPGAALDELKLVKEYDLSRLFAKLCVRSQHKAGIEA